MKQIFNKLKNTNETLLAGIVILIVVIGFIFYNSKNNSSSSTALTSNIGSLSPALSDSVAHSDSELCKKGTFTAPLEQEVAYDKEIGKDEFVQYLRKVLDGSTSGDSFDLADYADYVKSKFIVLTIDDAAGGGASIVLMFKDKPDKVFYAWVYDYLNGKYDLRDFTEYDLVKNGAPNIEETQKRFTNQLCDKDFGI